MYQLAVLSVSLIIIDAMHKIYPMCMHKVIGLSVCRCRPSQKTGIFRDLQVQVSHEWYKTQNRRKTDISVLMIHECDKS